MCCVGRTGIISIDIQCETFYYLEMRCGGLVFEIFVDYITVDLLDMMSRLYAYILIILRLFCLYSKSGINL